jgi:hypothetical protein
MLAVAVQLPAAVVAADREASAGAASASTAQVTDPTDFMLTTEAGGEILRLPYETLKPGGTSGLPRACTFAPFA